MSLLLFFHHNPNSPSNVIPPAVTIGTALSWSRIVSMTSRVVLRTSSEGNCALGLPPLTGKRSIFSMVELLTWFQHIEILSGQRRFAVAVLNRPRSCRTSKRRRGTSLWLRLTRLLWDRHSSCASECPLAHGAHSPGSKRPSEYLWPVPTEMRNMRVRDLWRSLKRSHRTRDLPPESRRCKAQESGWLVLHHHWGRGS